MGYSWDAELEKHGMIMSNSSSNRAIPFNKMVDAEFFIPPDIRIEQKGMQGDNILNPRDHAMVTMALSQMREVSIERLLTIQKHFKVHKQTLNRYISPWSMQKKIMTGTRESWDGVMLLRNHKDADPSAQIWAKEIQCQLDNSIPTDLEYGQWHLPYVTSQELHPEEYEETRIREAKQLGEDYEYVPLPVYSEEQLLVLSSGRCARTSYRLFDGSDGTYADELGVFNKLVGSDPKHATPLEHQGLCVEPNQNYNPNDWIRGQTYMMADGNIGSGRMIGWVQNRHWWDYDS
jgi:hypothetical protein